MRKINFLLLIGFASIALKPATSIYSINIQKLDGSTVNLGSFSGKKMIIIEFDAGNYDKSQLKLLDSLQKANAGAIVIGVPAKDFGTAPNVQTVKNIATTLNLSLIITQPVFVKRSAGGNQHPLFKWLTNVSENTHFNYDADQPGQIFMVSEKGELYALLYKAVTSNTLKEAASQKTK